MRKNTAVFGLLLMLVFTMVMPIGILLVTTTSGPTIEMEVDISNIETTQYPTNVVINEILFDDVLAGDEGEYVELYNPTDAAIDMSGWKITDEESGGSESVYQFPTGTVIPSRGFIIIFQDIAPGQLITPADVASNALVQIFETISSGADSNDPSVADLTKLSGIDDLEFANGGDECYLKTAGDIIVDSVSYGPSSPTTINVAEENRLLTPGSSSGGYESKSIGRKWASYGWEKDGYGNAVKQTPSPGSLIGETPSYGDEDPFGDGIPDNVVINEVFFGPMQTTSFNGHLGSVDWQFNQFVEIYNPTDENINVTGWTIEDNENKWMFVEGKHADELGDSDMLIIYPDRNDEDPQENYIDPDDDESGFWDFWNNVDKMETYYSGDPFNWWEDCKGNTLPPDYDQEYQLIRVSGSVAEFELDAAGDYVILRDKSGTLVDVVCWGTGKTQMIGITDAYNAVGDQNAGTNHGLDDTESLERIWQNHEPVANFLYGPGVIHDPTPGKVVGDVPDEIEGGSHVEWDNALAGAFDKGTCGNGLRVTGTAVGASAGNMDKWNTNPKDNEPQGDVSGLDGIVFWRFVNNVTINSATVTVCYGSQSFTNESTVRLYVWDHVNSHWDLIGDTPDTVNHKISGSTTHNAAISATMWIGVFGEKSSWFSDIPAFEWAFVLTGLLSIILVLARLRTREPELI